MTIFYIVTAMTSRRIIGLNNKLPWHIKSELQYFKSLTMGMPLIMGSRTFASLPKLLPGRHHFVLTSNRDISPPHPALTLVHSLAELLDKTSHLPEIMVIGGATVYQQFLPLAAKIYISLIKQEYPGDTYFPILNLDEWHLINERDFPEFVTQIWERKTIQ